MRGKRLSVKPSLHQRPPTCWTMWSLRDEQPRRSVDLRAVRGSAVGQEGRDRQTWSPASLDNWSQGWEAQEPPYRKEDRPGLQVQSWPQVREVVSTTAMTGIPAQTQCCPAVLPFHGKQGRPTGSGPERQALASAQAAELAGGELRGRCCFSGALGTDAEPRAGRSHPALGRPGDWPAASRRPEGSGGGGRGAGAWLSEGRATGTSRRALSRRGGGDRALRSLLGQAGSGCHLEKQLRAGVPALRKLRGPAGAAGRGEVSWIQVQFPKKGAQRAVADGGGADARRGRASAKITAMCVSGVGASPWRCMRFGGGAFSNFRGPLEKRELIKAISSPCGRRMGCHGRTLTHGTHAGDHLRRRGRVCEHGFLLTALRATETHGCAMGLLHPHQLQGPVQPELSSQTPAQL